MNTEKRRYLVTETCEYIVEAETAKEAEAIFLDQGPALPSGDKGPVSFVGVTDRDVETADA